MAFNFHLPDIGEGVVEGEIVSWKVAEGDRVELDQPMVEVMTDKATVEIPSPRAGTIAKINFQAGEICPVGDILGVIDEGAAAPREHAPGAPAEHAAGPHAQAAAQTASRREVAAAVPEVIPGAGSGRTRVLATPATRRLARQLGVDLALVPATGKRGRVTSDDVRAFGQAPRHAAPAAVAPIVASVAASVATRPGVPAQPIAIAQAGDEERIPFRGMRKRIADNMSRSKLTAAHFTYVEEVDMTELVVVRDQARKRADERGIKLTYLPFIVKAIVSGLKKWPQLNASLDETTQEIVRKKYYHIGIAAQGPQGLAVSVLRDADKRSIFGLAQEIERLGVAVREGKASREELTGSTFTITSLGKLGGVLATPIINFPEVGIVGVHKMEQRPAVRQGAIVVRWLMNLSISLDHRLVDGWDGAMFLQDVKGLLEDPTTMFMEMV
jgi:pyruvate dehydrogenase E2 component (dihydrolipoamide acetyltransferase)